MSSGGQMSGTRGLLLQHQHGYPVTSSSIGMEQDISSSATAPATAAHRKGPWSPQEDQTLLDLVGRSGNNLNWVHIASTLGTRTAKQCRERYHQNLKPSLNLAPISPEEGQRIEELVRDLGHRWAEIARRLNNRSDNAVKNYWNGGKGRRKRHQNHHSIQQQPAPSHDSSSVSTLAATSQDHCMSPPSTSPAAPSPPRPAHDYHHQHHQQQQHHYQLQRPSIPEQLRLPVPNTVAPGPISPTGTPSSGSAHSASQLHPHYHHHYHLQGPHYPGHTQQHNARHGYVDSPLPSPTGPPPSLCSDTTSTTSSSASPSVAASYESSPSATITTPRTGVPVLSAALARGPFFRLPEPSTANLKPTAYDGHQSQLQQYSPPLSPLSVHRQEQQRVPSPPREAGPTLPPILGGGGSRPAASTAFLGMVLN